MMDLSGLVNGFQTGMGGGLDLMTRQRALQEQARVQAAQRAIAQGQINNAGAGGAPQNVPMPGATPMPGAQGPMAAPTGSPPLPTGPTSFMPQQPQGPRPPMDPGMSVPSQPPGRGAPITGAALGSPGGPPPAAMMRGGAAPQASSPGASPAAAAGSQPPAPPSFSGVAQPSGNLFEDGQTTVNRIFQQLIQQNPELKKDPQTLFTAAEQQIGLLKGVNTDLKTMMQYQLGTQKLQYSYDSLTSRTAKWQQESLDRAARLEELSRDKSLDRRSREKIAAEAAATRVQVAGMHDATTERGQDLSYDARNYATDSANARSEATTDERGREADNRDAVQDRRTDVGNAGQDPKNPVARPQRRAFRPTQLPRRGQGGPAGARAPQYRSADDVVNAYKGGKLTRDQATKILQQNGWAS